MPRASVAWNGWVLFSACGGAHAPSTAGSGLERVGWEHTTAGGVGHDVYTPVAAAPAEGRPLMIVDGCSQSATDLKSHVDWEAVSEAFGAVISLPTVPNGGKFAGCWDYYGPTHTRTSGDSGKSWILVDALEADAALGIDPDRVSIAGLSSGAGMAMVMGCVAPDVFSGVGIAAGPTVGTTAFQIASVATNLSKATGVCLAMAGTHVDAFDTQLVGVIAGTNDFTVAQGYASLNADVFAGIYADVSPSGAPLTKAGFPVTALEGFQPKGTGTLYSDAIGPRVSLISATGNGHAWPAGTGPGPVIAFVASEGVNYAWTLADFFARNSRRADPIVPDPGDDDPPIDTDDPVDEDPVDDTTTDPDNLPCEAWVDTVEDDINGHLSRYDVYPLGYGVVDVTYVDLLDAYGVFGPFTLYQGVDGDWYHDPAAVPASPDCP